MLAPSGSSHVRPNSLIYVKELPGHFVPRTFPHVFPAILFRKEDRFSLPPAPPGVTLTRVEIELQFDAEQIIRFENLSPTDGNSLWSDMTFKWSAWYGTPLPNPETLTNILERHNGIRHPFAPRDGVVDFSGDAGFTLSAGKSGSGSFAVTDPTFLSAWSQDASPELNLVELSRGLVRPGNIRHGEDRALV